MGLVNRHLVLSSFLNPLAADERMSTLAVGFFEKEVIELLAETLNFTYMMQHPLDVSGPGRLVENGSESYWNGCMGQIHRKEVDACVTFTQITETEQRRMVADFSEPIVWEDIGMIMPAPRQLSRAFLIFYTFSYKIWICLFFAVLCVMLLLWLTYRKDEIMGPQLTLSRWFLYMVASLSTGERSFFMNNIASRPGWMYRWMTIFWIFPASVVLIKIYTSVILSMSAVPNQEVLIEGIWELPGRPDVTIFVYLGSNTDIYFSNHNSGGGFKLVVDELRSDPIKRLTPSFNVPVAIEAIEKNKKAVFLASRSACQSIIDTDLLMRGPSLAPRLVLSDEIFMSSGRQIIFQKNSPLTELFNKQIALLRENGLIQQAAQSTMFSHSKSLKGQLNANEQMNDGHGYLKFEDLTGIFYILIVGFVASTLTFLLEVVWHKIYDRNNVIVV